MKRKSYPDTHAVYGNVGLDRGFCPRCQTSAFVVDGCLQCCGSAKELATRMTERMSEPIFRRRKLSGREKNEIMSRQDYECFYCQRPLGALVFRIGKSLRLKVEYDHVVPHSYAANQAGANFVAACHVCNGLKSNLMFNTVEEAQVYLRHRWDEKGYYD